MSGMAFQAPTPSTSSSEKAEKKNLLIAEKLELIQVHEGGISEAHLMEKYMASRRQHYQGQGQGEGGHEEDGVWKEGFRTWKLPHKSLERLCISGTLKRESRGCPCLWP